MSVTEDIPHAIEFIKRVRGYVQHVSKRVRDAVPSSAFSALLGRIENLAVNADLSVYARDFCSRCAIHFRACMDRLSDARDNVAARISVANHFIESINAEIDQYQEVIRPKVEELLSQSNAILTIVKNDIEIADSFLTDVRRSATTVIDGVADAAAATKNAGASAVNYVSGTVLAPFGWLQEVYTNYLSYEGFTSFMASHWLVVVCLCVFLADVFRFFVYLRTSSKDKIKEAVVIIIEDAEKKSEDITMSKFTREGISREVRNRHLVGLSEALFMAAVVLTTSLATYRTVISNVKMIAGSRFNNKLVSVVDACSSTLFTDDEPVDRATGVAITKHSRYNALKSVIEFMDLTGYTDDVSIKISIPNREVTNNITAFEALQAGMRIYHYDSENDTFTIRLTSKMRLILTTPQAQVLRDHYATRALVAVVTAATMMVGILSTYYALDKVSSLHKRQFEKLVAKAVADYYADKAKDDDDDSDDEVAVDLPLVREGKNRRKFTLASGDDDVGAHDDKTERRIKQYDSEVAEADKVSGIRHVPKYKPEVLKAAAEWVKMGDAELNRQKSLKKEALASKNVVVKTPSVVSEVKNFANVVNPNKLVIKKEGAQLSSPSLSAKTCKSMVSIDVTHDDGKIYTVSAFIRHRMSVQRVYAAACHGRVVSAILSIVDNAGNSQTYKLSVEKCWSYIVMPGCQDWAVVLAPNTPVPLKSLSFNVVAAPSGTYSGLIYSCMRQTISCGEVSITNDRHIDHKIDTQEGDSGSLIFVAINVDGKKLVAPVGVHVGHQVGGNIAVPMSTVYSVDF